MSLRFTFYTNIFIKIFKFIFLACGNDQYDCEDLTCIASELRCNKVENCRFRWDEDGCPVYYYLNYNLQHFVLIYKH
jgi:hypothetical protein